jgi:hypothetical protein
MRGARSDRRSTGGTNSPTILVSGAALSMPRPPHPDQEVFVKLSQRTMETDR